MATRNVARQSDSHTKECNNFKQNSVANKVENVKCIWDSEVKQFDFTEPNPKCGEILVTFAGNFTFVCAFCLKQFGDLEGFGIHVRELHMPTEVKKENSEIGIDPLLTFVVEEGPTSGGAKIGIDKKDDSNIEWVNWDKDVSDDDRKLSELKVFLRANASTIQNRNVISTDKDVEKYKCNDCDRSYQHKRSYQSHLKKVHVKRVQLSKPLKVLDDIPALNMPVGETTCKYCDEKLEDIEKLQAHLCTHTGRKRFVCRFCSKTFSCRTTRLQHLSIHTGERHFKCPHCPKTFSGKSNLTNHIRAHLKIKNYSCDFCDKKFVQSSEKKVHERTHTGEKPHQCEECGRRYPTSGKLSEHLRRHKNIKNYKCEICGKAFFGLNLLKNHMPTHTGEKPFSCNICGQNFPRKKSLKTHKQLHSGEKNYVCSKCGKAFAQFAGLYSHMKSHGEKPR